MSQADEFDFSTPTGPEPVQDLRIVLDDPYDTRLFGQVLAEELRAGDVVILAGDLGAGKTTLTQAIAEHLGIQQPVTSPTFVIARHHKNPAATAPDLVHVDAYRLESADELSSLDLESTQDQAITVIEWGRGLAEELGTARGWLDIELFRARSAPAGTEPIVTDFSDDDVGEPRIARVRAYGQRYRDAVLTSPDLSNPHPDALHD